MNSFKQFLEEGRDAPLYHGTDTHAAIQIIDADTLEGRTDNHSRLEPLNSWGEKKKELVVNVNHFKPKKYTKFNGSSFSRDMRRSLHWRGGGLCFEVDQRKLSQRHKLVPINIFMAMGYNKHAKDEELAEEFVIGDIKNFRRYITRIIFLKEWDLSTFLLNAQFSLNPDKLLGFRYFLYSEKKTYDVKSKKDFINMLKDLKIYEKIMNG
jgi:hypothetical protein